MNSKLEITEKKLNELQLAINHHKGNKGPLMPILHKAQHIFGCIPLEIQKVIAEELDLSVADVNGVVTFYSQFSIEPKGKHVIGVCLGTACYVRGAQEIIDTISKELRIKVGETSEDGAFTLQATRCIGACGLAPVFTIGEQVFGNSDKNKALNALKELKG